MGLSRSSSRCLRWDLGVFNRKAHVVSVREALRWSAFWVALGLSVSVFIYFGYEHQWAGMGRDPDPVDGTINNGYNAALKYLTGYIVEESLSVDNIFVIAMLLSFFRVPAIYQHRVLFWGILGALIMRGAMIGIGATLIARFHWIIYIFGILLIFTAIKMLFMGSEPGDPNKNIIVRLARRFFPITEHFHGEHFLVRAGSKASHEAEIPGAREMTDAGLAHVRVGTWMFTPLALALITIETTDVVFAVDSIPAIFAITSDPFLVFTSNVFAVLGLRSLYFALAGMLQKFEYLPTALAVVLAMVGVKMLFADWFKNLLGEHFNLYLLGAVLGILSIGVIASILFGPKEPPKQEQDELMQSHDVEPRL